MTAPNLFRELDGDLTPMQIRAAEAFILDPSNKSAAMRAAGYKESSVNQASQFFKNPAIQAYIQQKRQQVANKSGITPDSVRARLVEAYDNAMANGQFSAAIRAAELMGKDVGMFETRSVQTINVQGAVEHGASGNLARLMGIAQNAGIVEGDFRVVEQAQIDGPGEVE